MIERIFKNWKTSALGVGIILITLLFVYLEKASLQEVSVFWIGALYFLYKKDDAKNTSSKS